MALTFPLPVSAFFGGLQVLDAVPPHLPDTRQISQTRGGDMLVAGGANRLWQGAVTLNPARHDDAGALAARLMRLTEPGASFLACPVERAGPIADPTGAILGAATPTLHSVLAHNRDLRITGLPAGYVISAGDYLSFAYGSDPVRYAFHQVVTGATANGAGTTPVIEVMPHVRPGFTVGTSIVLVRPFFKAILRQAGYGTMRSDFVSGRTLEYVQTLGA